MGWGLAGEIFILFRADVARRGMEGEEAVSTPFSNSSDCNITGEYPASSTKKHLHVLFNTVIVVFYLFIYIQKIKHGTTNHQHTISYWSLVLSTFSVFHKIY